MFDYFVYLLYRVEAAALTALPLRVLYAVGNGAGFFGWLLFGRYRRLARQNVTIAFGQEKSPRQLRRLVRQHFQRLCANLLCINTRATRAFGRRCSDDSRPPRRSPRCWRSEQTPR